VATRWATTADVAATLSIQTWSAIGWSTSPITTTGGRTTPGWIAEVSNETGLRMRPSTRWARPFSSSSCSGAVPPFVSSIWMAQPWPRAALTKWCAISAE
jgi:hypothetical protein